MNNGEVCNYIREMASDGTEYLADQCVKEGYGQLCGGYLSSHKKDLKIEDRSQKEHFLNYYSREDVAEKLPLYGYLRCPQLLLFIAEVAGVPKRRVKSAYQIIKKYEDDHDLRGREKNGNYLWGEKIFREFKEKLGIPIVVKVIRESKNWDEVKEETKKL